MVPDAAITALFIIWQAAMLLVFSVMRKRPQDTWRCPSCGRGR